MKQTKERIVAEGAGLLSRNGLGGVTLGVMAAQTGLSKSGLFAHFASKEDMQLQLLAETMRIADATVVAPAMKAPAGLKRLKAVFERWLGWSEKAGLGGGCAFAGAFFELDDAPDSDPVRRRLTEVELEWRGFLESLTKEAVAQGELDGRLDTAQFVWEMGAIYLHHHVSYRFIRDPKSTRRALTAFEELVRRSSPARKGSKLKGRATASRPRTPRVPSPSLRRKT